MEQLVQLWSFHPPRHPGDRPVVHSVVGHLGQGGSGNAHVAQASRDRQTRQEALDRYNGAFVGGGLRDGPGIQGLGDEGKAGSGDGWVKSHRVGQEQRLNHPVGDRRAGPGRMRERLRKASADVVAALAAQEGREHELQPGLGMVGSSVQLREPLGEHPQCVDQQRLGERVVGAGLEGLHSHGEGVQRRGAGQVGWRGQRHGRVEEDALRPGLRVEQGQPLAGIGISHRAARLGVSRNRGGGNHPVRDLGGGEPGAGEPAVRFAAGAQVPHVPFFCQQDGRRPYGDDGGPAADGYHCVRAGVLERSPGFLDHRYRAVFLDAVEASGQPCSESLLDRGQYMRMVADPRGAHDHGAAGTESVQFARQRGERILPAECPEGRRDVLEPRLELKSVRHGNSFHAPVNTGARRPRAASIPSPKSAVGSNAACACASVSSAA
jgi:hypothetical protein